jgi:hypothetical protein
MSSETRLERLQEQLSTLAKQVQTLIAAQSDANRGQTAQIIVHPDLVMQAKAVREATIEASAIIKPAIDEMKALISEQNALFATQIANIEGQVADMARKIREIEVLDRQSMTRAALTEAIKTEKQAKK